MTTLVKTSSNNAPTRFVHGSYTYHKVQPHQPISSVSAAGGEQTVFNMPSTKLINRSKIKLRMKITPDAQTLSSQYVYRHMVGCPEISKIELQPSVSGGENITILDRANDYTHSVLSKMTKKSDLMQRDYVRYDITNTRAEGYYNGIHPNRLDNSDVTAKKPDGTSSTVEYSEPQQVMVGKVDEEATPVMLYDFEFSNLKDTLFSEDLDMFFGDSRIVVTWAKGSDVFWIGDSATDPASGVATYTGGYSISNLYLDVPVQQDEALNAKALEDFKAERLRYAIDVPKFSNVALNASSLHTINVPFSNASGHLLKKIVLVPQSQSGNNLRYDSAVKSNFVTGQKIVSFQTFLDAAPLQQVPYVVLDGNEWSQKKDMLADSCVLTGDQFYQEYSHVHDFTGVDKYVDNSGRLISGLTLTPQQMTYTAEITTPGTEAITYQIWFVFNRMLEIHPVNGPRWI